MVHQLQASMLHKHTIGCSQKNTAKVAACKKMLKKSKQSTTDKNEIQPNKDGKNSEFDYLKQTLNECCEEGNVDEGEEKNTSFQAKGSIFIVKLDRWFVRNSEWISR